MVRSIFLLSISPFALTGCLAEVLTTTAIQGELAARNAQSGAQALNQAKDTRARTEAEHAIRAYHAEKGAYPPSLAALVPNYLASVPMHADGSPFGYDPASGRLLDEPLRAPQRGGFTATDQRNLEAIGEAILAYWESTGLYPRTLRDLEPAYMEQVPRLESGASFEYDAQTGAVYPPASALPAQSTPVAHGSGGGAGPLGETMTGIALQILAL